LPTQGTHRTSAVACVCLSRQQSGKPASRPDALLPEGSHRTSRRGHRERGCILARRLGHEHAVIRLALNTINFSVKRPSGWAAASLLSCRRRAWPRASRERGSLAWRASPASARRCHVPPVSCPASGDLECGVELRASSTPASMTSRWSRSSGSQRTVPRRGAPSVRAPAEGPLLDPLGQRLLR